MQQQLNLYMLHTMQEEKVKEFFTYSGAGLFRVCEKNSIYVCGWIFVSNELPIEEAIEKQLWYEKHCPHLSYTIVPIFKLYKHDKN